MTKPDQERLLRPRLKTRLLYKFRQWKGHGDKQCSGPLARLNNELLGYPTNHTYQIVGNEFHAEGKLLERWNTISKFYPSKIRSFLDVGSCKGYFVFRMAMRDECQHSVGIDLFPHFIDVSVKASENLQLDRARIYNASIEDVANSPRKFAAPFHLVQLISTYHYLYWGSKRVEQSLSSHERILATLAALCEPFLLFANPLEIEDCPKEIREAARRNLSHDYNRAAFYTAAEKYFDIIETGSLDPAGKRPLLLLMKRQ